MNNFKLRKLNRHIIVFLAIILAFASINIVGAESIPSVKSQAHVESMGWLPAVKGEATCGTIGKGLRLEGLKIALTGKYKKYIKYRAHVTDIGWQGWKKANKVAGTTGKGKAIEAIQIKLTGACAKKYDVYYRVHVPYLGWLGWAKNGASAGSTGISLRTEAIQTKIVKKNSQVSTGGISFLKKPTLTYKAHSETYGWGTDVAEGKVAGKTGEGKRLEAFTINFKDFNGKNGITYRAHVADIGWQDWVDCGEVAGTVGKGKQIEGIQIKLDGGMDRFFDVYYQLHVEDKGWLGWAKNGELAGSTGKGIRAEAMRICILPKGTTFDVGGDASL